MGAFYFSIIIIIITTIMFIIGLNVFVFDYFNIPRKNALKVIKNIFK
jgi:hypothetical protein